jgi:hypothetical protein
MANEFIARNGLIALDNSQITGSLNVSGSLSVNNTPAVLGSGTTNYLAKFTASGTVGNSVIFESGGNVGIGTTSPSSKLEIDNAIGSDVIRISDGAGFVRMSIGQEAGYTGNYINTRNIDMKLQTYLVGGSGGNIIFQTQNDGTDAVAERMRIFSGGNVHIGATPTADAGFRLDVDGTGRFSGNLVTSAGFAINANNGTLSVAPSSTRGIINLGGTTDNFLTFSDKGYIGQGSNYFQILARAGAALSLGSNNADVLNFALATGAATFSSLGTGTVYSNSGTLTNTNPSDKNLKTEIQDLSYGLNEIIQLRPVSFLWKDDKINQGKQFGFIAQEVQEVMPDLIKEGDYLGLDKEAIFTILVKAIQEQQTQIEELKSLIK